MKPEERREDPKRGCTVSTVSPTQPAWRTLHEGSGDAVILAVDFDTTGRTQAGFPELAAVWRPEATVLAALPPAGDVAPDAYVDHWLTTLPTPSAPSTRSTVPGTPAASGSGGVPAPSARPDEETRVIAVLGYCAGAVFAAALADRLAERRQDAPVLVLLDPELPDAEGLYEDYEASGRSLVTLLEPAEAEEFAAAARQTRSAHPGGDPALVGPELAAAYARAVDAAAERLDLDDDIRDELAGSFTAYVRYLAAASTLDPLPTWAARATALTSTPPEHAVAHEERIDTSRGDLLRDSRTAEALNGVLNGVSNGVSNGDLNGEVAGVVAGEATGVMAEATEMTRL